MGQSLNEPPTRRPSSSDETPPATAETRDEPVESWLADVAAAPSVSLRPSVGDVIDTFRIERQLGEGGMGVVYLAQDLTLARKVAIKLHRVATARAAERLLAEARAAGKIAHENVLVVYETGTWNDHVYIAMEYVDGWNARQWLKDAPRTWQEVVALYLEAGRGLAAAHAHGLVHRDFKPDNVLVARTATGGRGRARIADFGLARGAELRSQDGLTTISDQPLVTDGIAGSPAYMAPEQYVRGDVDARADQFGFCVALHEGLFGRRPFEGAELSSLVASGSSDVVALPRDAVVPSHVRRVLRRGLSPDPGARYPDMDTLLRELGHDPQVTRRRQLGLATAIVATGLVTWAATKRPDPMQGCTDTPAIATWWTPEQASVLRDALRVSGRSFADDAFTRIDAALTDYTAAAATSLELACTATHVEGTKSSLELQAHRECLTQRGREATALLEVLGEGDPIVVDRAVTAIDDLTPISYCDGKTGDDDLFDVTPEERPAVDAALELLARVRGLDAAGRFDQAVEVGEAGFADVKALGRPRLLALLQLHLATSLGERREFHRASEMLRDAIASAVVARADLVAAQISMQGIYVDGYQASNRELGEQWASLSAAFLDRGGSPRTLRRKLLTLRGMANRAADKFEDAIADQSEALAMIEDDPHVSPLERAGVLAAIGVTYGQMGKAAEGVDALTKAVAAYSEAIGEEHATYSNALALLGAMQMTAGDRVSAEASLVRALEIGERVLGPHSPRLVDIRGNLGAIYAMSGRLPEAIVSQRRALEDQLATGAPESHESIVLRANIGSSEYMSGQQVLGRATLAETIQAALQVGGPKSTLYAQQLVSHAEMTLDVDPKLALEEASTGLAIFVDRLDPKSLQRINAVAVHAMALGATGKCADAVDELTAALSAYEAAIGTESPNTIGLLVWLGTCQVEVGRNAEAIASLERAAKINASIGGDAIAQLDRALARARKR